MNTYMSTKPDGERNKGARYPRPEPIRNSAKTAMLSEPEEGASGWAIYTSKKVDDLSRHESVHDPKHDPKHGTHPDAPHEPHQKVVGTPKPGTDQEPLHGVRLTP